MTHEFDARRAEWIAKEELAERMIPLIGGLYRDHGVVTSIHGRRLINRSAIELLKAHRFARQAGDCRARPRRHDAGLEALREIVPGPASIDVPRLVTRYADAVGEGDARDARRLRPRRGGAGDTRRHGAPEASGTDVVLYGFGRIGRLLARILIGKPVAATACACAPSSCARAARTISIKRASLLRRDSVHGPFDGTIRSTRKTTPSSPTAT